MYFSIFNLFVEIYFFVVSIFHGTPCQIGKSFGAGAGDGYVWSGVMVTVMRMMMMTMTTTKTTTMTMTTMIVVQILNRVFFP